MITLSSVQLHSLVMSDSLRSHGLKRASPICPSPTPGVYHTVHGIAKTRTQLKQLSRHMDLGKRRGEEGGLCYIQLLRNPG